MTEPRWDLPARDDDAARARLWRRAPIAIGIVWALSQVLAVFTGVGVVLWTRHPRSIVAVIVLSYLPVLAAAVPGFVRARRRRAMLPGHGFPLGLRIVRLFAMVIGLGSVIAMTRTLDPRVHTATFFLCSSLLGIGLVAALAPFANPGHPLLPPRWSGTATALLAATPLVPAGLLVQSAALPTLLEVALVMAPLLVPMGLAIRSRTVLDAHRSVGQHDQVLPWLVHWRRGQLHMHHRARFLLHAGRIDEARDLAETFVRRAPPTSWAPLLQLAGGCALIRGDLEGARAHARTLLDVAPDAHQGYTLAAEVDLASGDVDDETLGLADRARQHLDRQGAFGGTSVQRDEANHHDLHVRLVHVAVLARLGQPRDARRELDGAIDAVRVVDDRPVRALLLRRAAAAAAALGDDASDLLKFASRADPTGIGRQLALSAGAG